MGRQLRTSSHYKDELKKCKTIFNNRKRFVALLNNITYNDHTAPLLGAIHLPVKSERP
jgi:hypothetical protein